MQRFEFPPQIQTALEQLRQPIAIYQLNNQEIVALVLSDGLCDLFGYRDRAQAYEDMECDMFVNALPDERKRVIDAAGGFLEAKDKLDVVYHAQKKDSAKNIVIHAVGEHLETGDGTSIAYVWHSEETGGVDSVATQMAYAQSMQKISELKDSVLSLLENMPAMTFSKDVTTGKYLACNKAFAKYAHKETPEDVVGFTDAEIFDAETAAHFVEDDKKALSMDAPYVFFEDVPDAAGNQKQFQTLKMKFIDSAGRHCLLGLCQDVSDAIRIQRERDTTKEAYEQAHNASIIYNHIAHALASDYISLFYVNMETDEFIEFHTDDQSGMLSEVRKGVGFVANCINDTQCVHPDDQAMVRQAMEQCCHVETSDNSELIDITFRCLHDNEPSFYVRMKASRIKDDKRYAVFAFSNVDEEVKQRLAEKRMKEERVVYARLHALSGNFLCVYVVDLKTGSYWEFSSTDRYVKEFGQPKEGTDFFGTLQAASLAYTHPEDRLLIAKYINQENVLNEIEQNGIFTFDYRLTMKGQPFHVQMKAALVEEEEGTRLIIGLSDNDAQYRQKEIDKEIARQKEIYDQITASLAEQYDTLYYVDIETSTYIEISSTDEYKKLNVPATGNDFFAESRRSIRKYVHPEDQQKALSIHYKDVMLDNLKYRSSYSLAWRLVVDNQVKHIRHTEIMARDDKHIIVCIENIDAEVQAELALKVDQKKRITFTQIAERLAMHYDFIYYIDCATSRYAELSIKKKSGELNIQEEGFDFFAASRKNIKRLVYFEDRNRIRQFIDRDNLITQLETRRQLTEDYRMIVEGGKTQYTRMSVTYSSDHSHFIICVENRDEDVRREKEHLAALSVANEMARRDGLTQAKNKTAYREMEAELQKNMEGKKKPFGIVVCDINGLKRINDTEGHKAGDDYIKAACKLISNIFLHSPVYRIGGDEFAVILKGQDYVDKESLVNRFQRQIEENIRIGEGCIVALGLAIYEPDEDLLVEDVFNRADNQMYEDKTRLKEMKYLQESRSLKQRTDFTIISDERRTMLDSLYKSFEVVSDGTYVFLCDMKFDFSRWSKSAVDHFGLPSEYMYGAGDIWEDCIHPDDRAAYHKGIDDIFAGNAAGHDMQYRALSITGEYDVCTCRGTVIRDPSGKPDYFVGNIRNHGIQTQVDTLTGLRNQYGFFEDLESCLKRNTGISVVLFGISKFSEINEMYGYHFGNRVLQLYARSVFESIGNTGHTYRIDGTKMAIISHTLSIVELQEKYNNFRAFLQEDFQVDGKKVLLDLHCGALRVENFDIDSQTIYSCLNYADEESKLRKQGNFVEFHNDLNENNHQRLEQLHAIRASIMHGYEGFFLLYQPVVDANTEVLTGAEALLRWKNDFYGMVPPDRFIPVLESDPLFPDLGEWIIRESIHAAKQILKQNPNFVINVNLSYTQIEKPDFVDMVLRILHETGYPPEHLCLEVTERCRLLDLNLLKNVLASLKSQGILIALDDFGTGFSSVGILKEIPIDIIKIDRSFVLNIETNDIEKKLIGNISELAHIFGAKVCVEGIETAGMRDILRQFHVGSFQGYYYAKPLSIEVFLQWMKS